MEEGFINCSEFASVVGAGCSSEAVGHGHVGGAWSVGFANWGDGSLVCGPVAVTSVAAVVWCGVDFCRYSGLKLGEL